MVVSPLCREGEPVPPRLLSTLQLVLIMRDKEDPTEVIQNIYNLRPRS